MLKNVRQALTMAAITGLLATAPLTLSNGVAFAADDLRWDPNTLGESNRGQQNQSSTPSVLTSAAVCRSPTSP